MRLLYIILNAVVVLGFMILKRILMPILKRVFQDDNPVYETVSGWFYEMNEDAQGKTLKENWKQGSKMVRTMYYGAVVLCTVVAMLFIHLFREGQMTELFYPVYPLLILAELYHYVRIPREKKKKKKKKKKDQEEEQPQEEGVNYVPLRASLKNLFGDKLMADETTADQKKDEQTCEELIQSLETSTVPMEEAYGCYVRRKFTEGLELDKSYLKSSVDLLYGKSILFNNPFYYDLLPYLFYPLNRVLLKHQKGLIVVGRHGTEEDIVKWCQEGLRQVTHVPTMWNIGVLSDETPEFDVGVLTRSNVHELMIHEANQEFFEQVGFVILVEPSKLLTTAQVGLRSIVQRCHLEGKEITYCSIDKNCDGLVDALSHVLMTNITEVSASNHHQGISSYMCWNADDERLQNRLVSNISSFLGTGTELAFAALKHQVENTKWYGGEAFPVLDTRWIVRQYYYSLLSYAERPTDQTTLDSLFEVDPNLWNAKIADNQFLSVEDESFNMFEVRREFATRAKKQGFVNILSTAYLLRDYMADNAQLFENDPKAIPYIVADYDRSPRNVALRLCLHMSVSPTPEELIRRELMLVDVTGEDMLTVLWHQVCMYQQPIGQEDYDSNGGELLVRETERGTVTFHSHVIRVQRRFDPGLGRITRCYSIEDKEFISVILKELQSAQYIAEDETGKPNYLGSELYGQIYQKHLPGQQFTLDGKYYEMLRGTAEGQILVRRAADHIEGRPTYRQHRSCYFYGLRESEIMGESRSIGGITLKYQYADIRVEVDSYWAMREYNDFSTAKKVVVQGIPNRSYCNKRVLCLEFSESLQPTREILRTLTLMINETFRTIFAENQSFILAVLPGEGEKQEFGSLYGEKDVKLNENCIYLVEDSQLDIGLLTAVERNYQRIFSIACDYLEWHLAKLEKKEEVPTEDLDPPTAIPQTTEEEQPKKKQFFLIRFFKWLFGLPIRFFKWIGGLFKKLFGKLFGKRKKKGEEPEGQTPGGETPPEETPTGETPEGQTPEGETPADETPTEEIPEGETPANETPTADATAEGENSTDEPSGETPAENPDEPDSEEEPPKTNESGEESGAFWNASESESPEPETDPEPVTPTGDTVSFEPEDSITVDGQGGKKKSDKYEDNYYLLYGGDALLAWIVPKETLEFLKRLGMDRSGLKQARTGKSVEDEVYVPQQPGVHYCDFCGRNLTGKEFDVLKDGRERCRECGSTAVRSKKEFIRLYQDTKAKMERLYGISITVPINVKVVNTRKLNKEMGKTFVATPGYDPRIVGLAVLRTRGGKKEYTLYLENGAPRLSLTMTTVHELTHIWQYQYWNYNVMNAKYQPLRLEVSEGMAMWAEIQYAFLIGESEQAEREFISTLHRQDEYGRGFTRFQKVYPVTKNVFLGGDTPFRHIDEPIPPFNK